MLTNNPIPRKRKSDRLSTTERSALRKFCKAHAKIVAAAEEIKIHRNVLDRVLLTGSGSPETIDKIRKAVELHAAVA